MIRKYAGIITGIGAGIVDIIPMLVMKLPAESVLSAFVSWVVIGFVISKIDIGMKGALKGMVTAVILIQPVAILISASEPQSLLHVALMTVFLGAVSGYVIESLTKKK